MYFELLPIQISVFKNLTRQMTVNMECSIRFRAKLIMTFLRLINNGPDFMVHINPLPNLRNTQNFNLQNIEKYIKSVEKIHWIFLTGRCGQRSIWQELIRRMLSRLLETLLKENCSNENYFEE